MFRRLAVTLALLSASAQADDFDDFVHPQTRNLRAPSSASRASAGLDDLLLRPDGSVVAALRAGLGGEELIPWSLVRLVLADVGDFARERDELVWLSMAPNGRETIEASDLDTAERQIALSSLAGSVVTDAANDAVGVVRGALLYPATGRVLALALDVGAYSGAESRTIAVPWSWLTVSDDGGALRLTNEADLRWIQSAPSIQLK